MNEYLYGLYSWYENDKHIRHFKPSDDPRITNKEKYKIDDIPQGKEIIDFLKSKCIVDASNNITEYYKDIKSFDFQASKNATDEDKQIIQDMINISYDIKKEDISETGTINWMHLNILRKLYSIGYSETISKKIIDQYALHACKLLKDINLSEKTRSNLKLIAKRTCENLYNVERPLKKKEKYNKILLEDVLIPDDNKQLIYSNKDITHKYSNNKKIIVSPWIGATENIPGESMGSLIWNLVINKASTNCIASNNNNWLFPIRIILDSNPNELFYVCMFENIINYLFMGFFLIRYNITEPIIPEGTHKECEKLYSYEGSLPHKSKEQYYVMFVFKYNGNIDNINNFIRYKYIIINFRVNLIYWGDVSELTRTLFTEIKQLMCIYLNDKINLYTLLKIDNSSKNIFNICHSQNSELNKTQLHIKKESNKCTESWYHKETYDYLKKENISLLSEDNDIHILSSNFNIQEIMKKLLNNEKIFNIKLKNNILYFDVNDIQYCILYCHFLWDDDIKLKDKQDKEYIDLQKKYMPNTLFNIKDKRFVLKHGLIDEKIKEEYKKNFCIDNECILSREFIKNIKLHTVFQASKENIEKYDVFNTHTMSLNQYEPLQTGGNENKYINKINNIINKLNILSSKNKNINNYYSLLPFNSYLNQHYNNQNKLNIFYDIYNNLYINGKIINNPTNLISSTLSLSYLIPYICDTVLIISNNINIADTILSVYKNIKITLLVLNIRNIYSFILLKKKYNNLINIYYIGNIINYNLYQTICKICKNNKYNSIVIDAGKIKYNNYTNKITAISILLVNKYLNESGNLIHFYTLPNKYDNYYYLLNIEYNIFIYKSYRPWIWIRTNNISNLFIYSKIKKFTESTIINNIIDYLKNDTINIDSFITSKYAKFLYLNWKENYNNYKLFIKYDNKNNILQDGSGYHNLGVSSTSIQNIPIYIDDINIESNFNIKSKDLPPLCHWGQKKLLLSEIQFFTDIKLKNIKSFKDYVICYIGSAHGTHLPILFNMFPDLIWLLYDPNPFSEHVKRFGKEKVFIYNMYFTDETIEHVKKNSQGRKIIFISDIRVTPTEEQVMADMSKQAEWGIKLDSEFMLLKFRLPYNNPDSIKLTTLKDLNINKKYISNPDFIAKDNIYLKGDLYIQLYPPPYSTELRLLVKKNKDGKYDLDNYNNIQIENKLFWYNSEIRGFYIIEEYNFLNVIIGFDNSIECIMEYNIIKRYYEYFENIQDNNIIIQKLYDINNLLNKLTNRHFIKCNQISIIKKNKGNSNNELKIIYDTWNNIINLNIQIYAEYQKKYINDHGFKFLGKKRTEESLKDINKYITKNDKIYELIL